MVMMMTMMMDDYYVCVPPHICPHFRILRQESFSNGVAANAAI
jgi:hypothetical protein